MPIMHGDKKQLAEIHKRYFGKMSPRTLERWPIKWRKVNGRNISSVRDFLAESKRRFEKRALNPGRVGRHDLTAPREAAMSLEIVRFTKSGDPLTATETRLSASPWTPMGR
jgi:hypothetical protein